MHPCPPDQADLLLDGRPYRCVRLCDAQTYRARLAGLKGVVWPAWAATQRRLADEPWTNVATPAEAATMLLEGWSDG
jgi:hypothetical protein